MKNHQRLVLFLILIGYNTLIFAQNKEKNAIFQIMNEQEKAWNSGDLEKFMDGYWKNDSLQFVGKNGITYGWKNTLQNYQKNYATPEAKGKLIFSILHFQFINKKNAFMIGKWKIERQDKSILQGHFTLIWRKIDNSWKIIADHSS
ncbi:MAG: DUF4440 domain-containing protein [Bacteroidetes bacterium]|nr:MAG: DUF4440 domain-containing protein [Bacteroidota bacterium]